MDFDKMIFEKQQEKEIIIQQMEKKKKEILAELVLFTSDWFDNQIIRSIKDHSDKLLDLGEEKARELKEKTTDLKDNTAQLVQKHIDVPSIWWHEEGKNTSNYLSNNSILPELLEPIKYLFGELGVILLEYGLEDTTTKYSRIWDKDYGNSNVRYSSGFAYSSNSSKLCKLSVDYVSLIETGKIINEEISKTEDKKKRENIEEWWVSL